MKVLTDAEAAEMLIADGWTPPRQWVEGKGAAWPFTKQCKNGHTFGVYLPSHDIDNDPFVEPDEFAFDRYQSGMIESGAKQRGGWM